MIGIIVVAVAAVYFFVLPKPSEEQVSLEIWVTKGEDSQAMYSTMTSEETENAHVWVKGSGGTTISFQIWVTFPDGVKTQYGPSFQTNPAGSPVHCGGFASALSQGAYIFEVMRASDNAVLGSTTLTVTAPSFTVSASPDNFTIARGENRTITLSYSPQVPSSLNTSTSISGPSPSIQLGGWIEAPFTFPVVVPADAALGTHTVTLVFTDQNTGKTASTTITVNVTSA